MSAVRWIAVVVSGLSLVLAWIAISLAIENDGLRQVIDGHRRSIQTLLRFTKVSSRCDLSPQEVAAALSTGDHVVTANPHSEEVGDLAFVAKFRADHLHEVSIVDVEKVEVCGSQ
jgi:hypothetical protein